MLANTPKRFFSSEFKSKITFDIKLSIIPIAYLKLFDLFRAEVYIPLRSQVLIVLSKDPILFKYIPSPPDNPPGTPCNATFSPKSSVIVKIQPVRGNSSTANPDPTYLRNCHNHVNCSVPSVYILPTPTGPPGSTNPDPPPVVIEPGPPIEPNPIVQGKPTPRPDWVPKIKKVTCVSCVTLPQLKNYSD